MKRLIEIKSAEGGNDSKLFVGDLAKTFLKLATRKT